MRTSLWAGGCPRKTRPIRQSKLASTTASTSKSHFARRRVGNTKTSLQMLYMPVARSSWSSPFPRLNSRNGTPNRTQNYHVSPFFSLGFCHVAPFSALQCRFAAGPLNNGWGRSHSDSSRPSRRIFHPSRTKEHLSIISVPFSPQA